MIVTDQQTVRQAERVQAAPTAYLAEPRLAEPRLAELGLAVSHRGPSSDAVAAAPALHRALHRAQGLQTRLAAFLPRIGRVLDRAHTRVLEGKHVPALENVLSLFEPHTRAGTWAKAGVPIAFGRQVVFDAVAGGPVTRFHVLTDDNESACHQALPAAQHHQQVFGRAPRLLTGDRGLHTKGVEA